MVVETARCKGCGLCAKECPHQAIQLAEKLAVIQEACVSCGICSRVCPLQAVRKNEEMAAAAIRCTSCPVQCEVKPGFSGACRRYTNENGILVRNRPFELDGRPDGPLITAVGAGTNYPCCRPAPHIVMDVVDDVEVVTVVTEAPLSYSGVKVKIDTNLHVGEEGSKIRRNGKIVGMVDTEEYGSKMLSIGGANLLTGKDGFVVARTIVDFANGQEVTLNVEGGGPMTLQAGKPPVVNGVADVKMRVGCGSATIGMFAAVLKTAVDEAIILDHHVVGLLSEHLAGAEVGLSWSGVVPNARKSTRGRYFGEPGAGWGGTDIFDPRQAVREVDMTVAKPGMTLLVTETTGQKAAMFRLREDGELLEIPLTEPAKQAVSTIADNCEQARVSVLYTGGVGGSARAGVAVHPLKVTQAVHQGKARLTIGGADTYILPGGGINFMVDVERVVPKGFSWVPTPATVAPVEYTMPLRVYEEIGGHLSAITPLAELKSRLRNDVES
ncbi:MAG TPA: 4Fe-4S binding protein [Patescibacteria group bacterium]|nr:4Fe-4S binding protein [Patescibacteria group bacterium]